MKKTWTEEEILNILETNDTQLCIACVNIYRLQTRAEQESHTTRDRNNVGFSAYDAKLLSSFAEQYLKYRRLSSRQIEILRKRMKKYRRQLVAIANERG